ncbi:MAG: glycosyltransferase family 2 protein [bacterium]
MLSIIIPTLNEAANLPCLLDDLKRQRGIDLQVIVADGGSTDGTLRNLDVDSVVTRPNRAAQLNAGAEIAVHDSLLFLHADSRVPDPDTLAEAARFMGALPDSTAGHFRLRFVGPQAEHPGFRYLEKKTELNRPNTTNGDQGFWVPRALFDCVGGFDETLPFLEDQRFAEAVRRVGQWVTLPGWIETSTRRFAAEGFGRRYLTMAIMMGVYDAGVTDFFERVAAYRPHPDQRLDLGPVIRAMYGVTLDRDWRDALKMWEDVGRFVRGNAWQIALLTDVYLLEDNSTPCLRYYEQVVEPQLDHVWLDRVAAYLTAGFFLGAVPLYWAAKQTRSSAGR